LLLAFIQSTKSCLVPPERSIERLACVIASRIDAAMVRERSPASRRETVAAVLDLRSYSELFTAGGYQLGLLLGTGHRPAPSPGWSIVTDARRRPRA